MHEVSAREIKVSELAASVDLIRSSFLTVAKEFGLTKENSPTNGAFLEYNRLLSEYNRGIKMFGLFRGSEQVGFVALEEKEGGVFYLEKLAVLPEYRHKGYGRILIDYSKAFVAEHGGKEISIGIIYENKRLLSWYELYGFEVTGTKRFEHLPFTVCFMRLYV